MKEKAKLLLLATLCVALTSLQAWAQGIDVKSKALILSGSSRNCTAPASIDYKKVRLKTPEWKTIRGEGVRKGSARYTLLLNKMDKRIKDSCRAVAADQGKDCVIRKGDVSNARGLKVVDMTSEVINRLESR
ncbi:MAG: hypothetical protein ACYTG5_15410 [Planctomycetota bacterium]|jgi:hypothetical protein